MEPLSRSALPVPLVTVSGFPGECGAGYGVLAADRIEANLDVYRRRFAEQAGLDAAAVRRAGAAFRAGTATAHPRIAEMLDGLAEGAGVAVEEVYALNARTELLYDAAASAQRLATGPAAPPPATAPGAPLVPPRPPADGPDGGCTALGVLGTHTASGHLLLAQNWDWHPDQREAMVLLATRDEYGHVVLTLTEAGMLAKTGLNSAGLGVCVNLLGSDRDGTGPAGGVPGVPYHVLLRAVLEADSLSWATRAACRSPRSSSINLLIGQAAHPSVEDPAAGGELIDLELVPGDAGWLHPVDGLLTHANHLESTVGVFDTMKQWGGSSLFRSARARRLLGEPALVRKVTEADLIAVLRDHASYPAAICRHTDEREPVPERSQTVYSIVLDLDGRRMGVAAGPPCEHEYAWCELAEVTAGLGG